MGDVFDKGDPKKLFKLLNKLATGSYGTVFKAQQKKSNDAVALKVIALEDNDSLDEFLPEITIMRALSHPNIVKLHGAWKKGHDLFIAMELCVGGAASDLYSRVNKPVPEPVIQIIMRDTLRALEYTHERAIIHRDIKAANILLTGDGAVKLTDFGVSVQMESPNDKRKSFIGTPYWLAPEVVMVNLIYQPYSNKVDLWSLGITCIELAETKPPRFGLDPTKAMNEIPRSPPPKLAEERAWSDGFRDFLALCLEKNPEKRPPAREQLKHPWIKAAGDVKVVADYIKKTQRGEWDPSTGQPPAAPPPPVKPQELERMAPTTQGRRMTKASIDEVLRMQSEMGGPLNPQFAAMANQPPGPASTQLSGWYAPPKPPQASAPKNEGRAPATTAARPPVQTVFPAQPPPDSEPEAAPAANGFSRHSSDDQQAERPSDEQPEPSPPLLRSSSGSESSSGLQPSWSRPPGKPPPSVPKLKPNSSYTSSAPSTCPPTPSPPTPSAAPVKPYPPKPSPPKPSPPQTAVPPPVAKPTPPKPVPVAAPSSPREDSSSAPVRPSTPKPAPPVTAAKPVARPPPPASSPPPSDPSPSRLPPPVDVGKISPPSLPPPVSPPRASSIPSGAFKLPPPPVVPQSVMVISPGRLPPPPPAPLLAKGGPPPAPEQEGSPRPGGAERPYKPRPASAQTSPQRLARSGSDDATSRPGPRPVPPSIARRPDLASPTAAAHKSTPMSELMQSRPEPSPTRGPPQRAPPVTPPRPSLPPGRQEEADEATDPAAPRAPFVPSGPQAALAMAMMGKAPALRKAPPRNNT